MTSLSATLAMNERMAAMLAAGERLLPLGFGEAGLPVLPEVGEVLAGAADRNGYGPVVGSERPRSAAAGWFSRRGLATDPDQVIFAPGSKALLFALLTVLPGDVVLPQPSWVSYAAHAALAGKRVVPVPVPDQSGGVPDPERLDRELSRSAAPGILVVTTPDNPTGTVPDAGLIHRVCEVAERHGLVVVSDEIYRDLAFDPAAVTSPASLLPDRSVVTSGLSKSMALGGWRVGFARVPDARLRAALVGVASEVWSSLAAPMQEVAAFVLDEPEVVRRYIAASRTLHQRVVEAAYREVAAAGAVCRRPQGGFYLYPDYEPLRPQLAVRGIHTGEQLAELLLLERHVGVLAGRAFGDDPAALRFRIATSLLYGTEPAQRWEALRSDDPLALPWIADALANLRTALRLSEESE